MSLRRQDPLANPERMIRRVYSYVAYLVGDGPEAEDITSEAVERMIRYSESYDPEKGAPVAWALGIARRCIAARVGEPTPLPEDDLEQLAEPAGDVDAVDRLTVRDAVSRLPAHERELVALRYGADLTARQIGELLGVRTNTVEVGLHRAHARLRAELAADFRPVRAPRDDPAHDAL